MSFRRKQVDEAVTHVVLLHFRITPLLVSSLCIASMPVGDFLHLIFSDPSRLTKHLCSCKGLEFSNDWEIQRLKQDALGSGTKSPASLIATTAHDAIVKVRIHALFKMITRPTIEILAHLHCKYVPSLRGDVFDAVKCAGVRCAVSEDHGIPRVGRTGFCRSFEDSNVSWSGGQKTPREVSRSCACDVDID